VASVEEPDRSVGKDLRISARRSTVRESNANHPRLVVFVVWGVFALLACDSNNPVAPPSTPVWEGILGGWFVEIVSSSGESHQGTLGIGKSQEGDQLEGEIFWKTYQADLHIWGNLASEEFSFHAQWGGWGCSWEFVGEGSASVFDNETKMEGNLDLNWPCDEDQGQSWDFTAIRL